MKLRYLLIHLKTSKKQKDYYNFKWYFFPAEDGLGMFLACIMTVAFLLKLTSIFNLKKQIVQLYEKYFTDKFFLNNLISLIVY